MSLTYAEMRALHDELRGILLKSILSNISFYSPKTYILTFQNDDEHYHLLICLQEPFLRFHLSRHKPRAHQENTSPFLNQLQKSLTNTRLVNLELRNEDRILALTFYDSKHTYELIYEFFPKKTNAYLVDGNLKIISSLKPVLSETYTLPEKNISASTQILQPISSLSTEKLYHEKELQFAFKHELQAVHRSITSKLKYTKRFKEKSIETLQACSKWQEIHHEGLLLQSHFHLLKRGMRSIDIPDWENEDQIRRIELDDKLNPSDEVSKRFLKSRKLKAGLPYAQEMIGKAEKEIHLYENMLSSLSKISVKHDLDIFLRQFNIKKTEKKVKEPSADIKSLPYREFYSAAGLKIWVGKSAKENEELTFRYSKGSDWWLHVHGYPGSHVLVKAPKHQELDQETLQDAIQLAIYYSKAKENGYADICVTQCKYVIRYGKGKVGKVQIAKSRIIPSKSDLERLKHLKARKHLQSGEGEHC